MFEFPSATVNLIMHGISSATITLLRNRSDTESFNLVHGLRKGDPLSPYLFVLCMECLGHMISKEVDSDRWSPIQLSRNSPYLLHLFFAVDVLLFIKAKPSQARLVNSVLEHFCFLSSLKVSLEKSKIHAAKGIIVETRPSQV